MPSDIQSGSREEKAMVVRLSFYAHATLKAVVLTRSCVYLLFDDLLSFIFFFFFVFGEHINYETEQRVGSFSSRTLGVTGTTLFISPLVGRRIRCLLSDKAQRQEDGQCKHISFLQ